jgi:hypothetical protein
VTALVSTRIYPSDLPQQIAVPAIVYRHIDTVDRPTIHGDGGAQLVQSRISVIALANDYSAIKAIHEAVKDALRYQYGVIAGVQVATITRDIVGPDLFDPDLERHEQGVDYLIVHTD